MMVKDVDTSKMSDTLDKACKVATYAIHDLYSRVENDEMLDMGEIEFLYKSVKTLHIIHTLKLSAR